MTTQLQLISIIIIIIIISYVSFSRHAYKEPTLSIIYADDINMADICRTSALNEMCEEYVDCEVREKTNKMQQLDVYF